MNSVRVLVVANNRLLRETLGGILTKRGGIEIIGAFPFCGGAIEQITAAKPDVLILDAIPDPLLQLGFVRQAQQSVAGMRTVLIGMEAEESVFFRAIRDGAIGYVLKDASAAELLTAVQAVAQNEVVCPARCCSFLFDYVARHSSSSFSHNVRVQLGLTRREQQLVRLIGDGCTNTAIAAQLSVSEQTVKNHIHHILRKTGAPDRMAVVELFRAERLIL
jgi:DNA-binding NarL/FixJ family response regulator